MSILVIKDLPESVDLDRQAMLAITGGARTRGRQAFAGRTLFRHARIVSAPTGFASRALANTTEQTAGNTPRK